MLWNAEVPNRCHQSNPLAADGGQFNPVHKFTGYVFKIYFNIILPSVSTSQEVSF